MSFDEQYKSRATEITGRVIGAAIEVHRHLGPGLLESAYETCFCRELELLGMRYSRQMLLAVEYKGLRVENAFRIDLLVEDMVVVDLKCVDRFDPIHEAQVLTYLRLTNLWAGLLINFRVPVLKNGIKRLVLG